MYQNLYIYKNDIMHSDIDSVDNNLSLQYMNLQQFQYVLAVVDNKNFETAAETCFVTQSTLSTMINRFEDEIGIKLFNRKTKPVSITQEGVKVIERLRIIQKEIDSLNNVVQELKGEMVGELKIGVIPTIAPDLLPLFLLKFAEEFPKVKMIVQEMTTAEIQKALKSRALDVGILAIPLVDADLIELELYKEPFMMYDWSANVKKETIAIKELDYSKLWLLEEGHCLRTQVQHICELSNDSGEKNLNIEFKAGSLGSLLRFTKANKGITILPYLSALELSEIDREKLTPFTNPVPARSVGLVTHRHFVKMKLLEKLQEIIQQTVTSYFPLDLETTILKPF
jgi:LysR family hydrogen peroxide-inducible transcriptional activator